MFVWQRQGLLENKLFPAAEKGRVSKMLSNSLLLHIPSLCQDMNQGHSWFGLLLCFFLFFSILFYLRYIGLLNPCEVLGLFPSSEVSCWQDKMH